ncbi:kinase-like domain-containing protein [Lipomyces arxii]|uniref:kinase-like domain-containing protein n=1 Tax=Lipomyces arxii TaxID=56418 RepID=UPI0034CF66CF
MHFLPLLRSFRDRNDGGDRESTNSSGTITTTTNESSTANEIDKGKLFIIKSSSNNNLNNSLDPISHSKIYYSSSSSSSSSSSLVNAAQELTIVSSTSTPASLTSTVSITPLPLTVALLSANNTTMTINNNNNNHNSNCFVKETHSISMDYDPISGRKTLNTYEIIHEIGRGQHGKVKLGRDLTTGDYVAIKIMNRLGRPRLGRPLRPGLSQEEKIRREVAILKKCNHPHIVRLREVLDDPSSKKIFLVLEYVELGEIKWQNDDGSPAMSIDYARTIFRDVVLGLEYLHYKGIIHRDIKPANLLMTKQGVIKISDFGVSYISSLSGEDDELELAKTAGTPAFFAPELCYNDPDQPRPHITNKIDIWALGVTLFCLFYGRCPFTADNEFELFNVIAKDPLVFPDEPAVPEQARELLMNLLHKDPTKRMSISEIKHVPWVLEGLTPSQLEDFLSSKLLSR